MSHISAVFSDRRDGVLARHVWIIALIVTAGGLATWAAGHLQSPNYEASAVVQVQAGTEAASVGARIMGRDNLLSIVARHHLDLTGPSDGDTTAVRLSQAITINALTADAGQILGFQPQLAALVVSVRLSDAKLSARVANDVAQQILDEGNAGELNATHGDLEFYRRDERRLWQELSALRTGQQAAGTTADLVGQRRLGLMQDQYDLVRHKLAGAEIAARLSGHLQQGQYSLLRRATATEAVDVGQDWLPLGVVCSLLLAVTLAFVRELHALRAPLGLTPLHIRASWMYRVFDDPARPILGMPRYAVTSGLIVAGLYLLARMIG